MTFRGVDGDLWVEHLLVNMPGGELCFPSLVMHYKSDASTVDPATVEIKMDGGFEDSIYGDDDGPPIFK